MPTKFRALVIVGAGGRIVMVSVALPAPPGLVALMVTAKVPVCVDVPLIKPVPVSTLRPFGNPLAA